MRLTLLLLFKLAIISLSHGQRTIQGNRISGDEIALDGRLDETTWSQAEEVGDFTQLKPNQGEKSFRKTSVRLLYDDKYIYVGAMLYDDPNEVLVEYSERDVFNHTDWFLVILDPYNSGLNAYEFGVNPIGVQRDGQVDNGDRFRQDYSWDAVWEAKTHINEEGWSVEMRIPYSAIRFPAVADQKWRINFSRGIKRLREESYWSPIDLAAGQFLWQSGQLNGLKNIDPPVRLSATPFVVTSTRVSYDADSGERNWSRNISGGMDIKYGINEAFTLDMSLIPDFSQVRSDDQVLNLTPFEVFFDENRQFFTEGVEIFNKGRFFYSRRVGGRPVNFSRAYSELKSGEEILENPINTQLLNAFKISGRTDRGTGVGIFNAIVNEANALIKTPTGTREIQTNPLSNYSVLSVDQNLKNNSYITLINTNVLRSGETYDANTTGAVFQLNNNTNSYAIDGKVGISQLYYTGEDDFGQNLRLQLSKTSGKFQWNTYYNFESYNYNPNDLGYLFNPNERTFGAEMKYTLFNQGNFDRKQYGLELVYSRLHRPNKFSLFTIQAKTLHGTKQGNWLSFNTTVSPVEGFDFNEPRTGDFSRYFRIPKYLKFDGFISTDYRKRAAIDLRWENFFYDQNNRQAHKIEIEPRFRLNQHSTAIWKIIPIWSKNDVGFAKTLENSIAFGERDVFALNNSLAWNYNFSANHTLTFRGRHYWSQVKWRDFKRLEDDGRLGETLNSNLVDNANFNTFNIDLIYRWRFAPGSDIFVTWKNGVLDSNNDISNGYFYNLGQFANYSNSNTFSLKVLYFLDYNDLIR